jgi:Mu-like prophage I protein.
LLETAVTNVPSLDGGNEVWLEALPARTFHTPQYGMIQITKDKLARMVKNFNDRVRGQDIAIDYDHGMDRAKGNMASGWMKELALRPSSGDPHNPVYLRESS